MIGRVTALSWPAHLDHRPTAVASAIGVFVATVGYLLVSFETGAVSGIVLALLWLTLPTVYVVAGGYFLLGLVGFDALTVPAVGLVGLGLFFILVAPSLSFPRGPQLVGVSVLSVGVLGIITLGSLLAFERSIIAATILVVSIAMLSYGLVRYRYVALGGEGEPV